MVARCEQVCGVTAREAGKPVVVSMGGYAASGGYYVSCNGDSIFADPGTLTGSIGVYAGKMDRSAMYEKIGVNREFITRGRNALMMSDAGTFTPEQRRLFQGQMAEFYERFLAKVAELPISRWTYKDDPSATPHIGPMAEDFHAAFGLGRDDKSISVTIKWPTGLFRCIVSLT